MPEMPEVEQVRKTLAPHIEGKKILAVEIYLERLIKYPQPDAFIKGLVGKTISSVGRRGKYLVLQTAPNQQLIVHLRMTGALLAQPSAAPAPAYAKIKFTLSDGVTMWFTDIRTFGTLYLVTDNDTYIEGFETLGPEPLSEGFNAAYLLPLAQKSKKAIKSFILDQQIIAGLGNIYADEICFALGLHPQTRVSRMRKKDFVRLVDEMRRILSGAIAAGGTTIRSYTSSLGVDGRFQLKLKVHSRKGQPCPLCAQEIKKIVVGGRGTYLCTHCQKKR